MLNSDKLTVTLIQSDLYWENAPANRTQFEKKIQALTEPTDVIILPEMFTTGFSMNAPQLAETMNGETVRWMEKLAREKNAVITGSVIIKEPDNRFFNRLIWMPPDGNLSWYDKRHLFSMADEEKTYTSGDKRLLTVWRGWKICPMICYDLRFPVWCRNTDDYDLLIFVASWPHRRRNHWRILLPARAVENQAYVIGMNRTGNDGNGIYHSGDSMIIDPTGITIAEKNDVEWTYTYTLSKKLLEETKTNFPFLKDRDAFMIM